ncbi:FAD-dependent oxidoreductase [Paracoccus onubensis]|uniref:FAD-dependent oxidoreductase n=1 Tax=Paracoccus onubensis TaxID=1675788 RepID=UPI002730C2BE|nr:FAD-dependent oxidoreductase [Paracoccus onubensis]MDP0926690.1 FAD-dependent oxidoreductase [Paracoccus onubensis]
MTFSNSQSRFDFLVYRATPAGIMAAITAARLNLRTALIEPSDRIGGMMTSGLNAVDILNTTLVNGVVREFFRTVRDEYDLPYLPARIESKVALRVFRGMLAESKVELFQNRDIRFVSRDRTRIINCTLNDNRILASRWWVDSSYEGDLINLARLRYRLGREAADEFGESFAGRQPFRSMLPWASGYNVSPHTDTGRLLPYVAPSSRDPVGFADNEVQSYCIRPTLTNRPDNRIPITPPMDFDFGEFELFRRISKGIRIGRVASKNIPMMGTTFKSAYFNLAELPNGKFDMNSGPAAPLNNPMLTQGWVTATYDKRQEMAQAFSRYTRALLYFIQNDSSVPQGVRDFFGEFGLPADEYGSTDHIPPDVYVREGRRLVNRRIFRQQDIESGGACRADAICEAKYHLDCKPVHWRTNHSGTNIVREGMFFTQDAYRYSLPKWIILPEPADCRNFFSVCGVAATHVAFGSIRMEPTWMELGSAAAIMAYLANRNRCPVDDIPGKAVTKLRDERFFQWPGPRFLRNKLRDKAVTYYRKISGRGDSA